MADAKGTTLTAAASSTKTMPKLVDAVRTWTAQTPKGHPRHQQEAELLLALQVAAKEDVGTGLFESPAALWRKLGDLYTMAELWGPTHHVLDIALAHWTTMRQLHGANGPEWALVLTVNESNACLDLSYAHRYQRRFVEAEKLARQGIAILDALKHDPRVQPYRLILDKALITVLFESKQTAEMERVKREHQGRVLRALQDPDRPRMSGTRGDEKLVVDAVAHVSTYNTLTTVLRMIDAAKWDELDVLCVVLEKHPDLQGVVRFVRGLLYLERKQWDPLIATFADTELGTTLKLARTRPDVVPMIKSVFRARIGELASCNPVEPTSSFAERLEDKVKELLTTLGDHNEEAVWADLQKWVDQHANATAPPRASSGNKTDATTSLAPSVS